jgi:RNA recognition motif-containing protein
MNILVSNLSVHIMQQDLVRLFSPFGQVSNVELLRDPASGQSRGNAFVEMPFDEQAGQAIKALDGALIDGKRISVRGVAYQAGEFNN